jgi:hypothetical protein
MIQKAMENFTAITLALPKVLIIQTTQEAYLNERAAALPKRVTTLTLAVSSSPWWQNIIHST